jgi:hypothetical protein
MVQRNWRNRQVRVEGRLTKGPIDRSVEDMFAKHFMRRNVALMEPGFTLVAHAYRC